MTAINRRHTNARTTSRAFLESIFTVPGVEIPFCEICDRATAARIASSASILNNVCMAMTADGFLTRPRKGIYARADHRGVALALAEPDAAPAPFTPDAPTGASFAGLQSALRRIEAKVDVLTHGALDATDLGCIQRILGQHIREVTPVLDATGLKALDGLKSRVSAAMVASAVSMVKVNGEEVAHG
jgi:hypothetical protein